jgi:signal transduction histidine kinase
VAFIGWRRAGDLAVVGTLAVLAVLGSLVGVHAGEDPTRAWGACSGELLSAAALLARQRRPLLVLVVTTGCAVLAAVTADRTVVGPLLPAIALYTLAARSSWRVTAVAALAVITAHGVAASATHNLARFLAAATMLAVAAAIGLYVGEHRALAERSAAEQRLLAAQAVLAERVWIARELHDAVGHHVSLLVVQAGAVRTTLPEDHPARPVLDAMIDGGRETMAEMRRLVDVLRPIGDDGDGAAPGGQDDLSPAPGLGELSALCDRLRAGGLPLQVRIDVPTPPGRAAGITAYRIAQEALTNVVKHAGHVATRVEVTCAGGLLDLRVTNADPIALPADLGSGGRGLENIRRRAALFGGEVFAGPVPGGGYALRATLRLREP